MPSAFDRAAPTYGLVGTDFFSDLGHCLVCETRVDRDAKVLDVGAGTGAVTLPAAACSGPGGRVTAIDLSESMLRRLGVRAFGASSAPVAVAVMDATRLGLRDSSADAVVSGLVLSSLPRPEAAMHEICRSCALVGGWGFPWHLAGGGRRTLAGHGTHAVAASMSGASMSHSLLTGSG